MFRGIIVYFVLCGALYWLYEKHDPAVYLILL